MALEMKPNCQECNAETPPEAPVEEQPFICSRECTFCENCAVSRTYRCPNCDGLLVRRPPRHRPE